MQGRHRGIALLSYAFLHFEHVLLFQLSVPFLQNLVLFFFPPHFKDISLELSDDYIFLIRLNLCGREVLQFNRYQQITLVSSSRPIRKKNLLLFAVRRIITYYRGCGARPKSIKCGSSSTGLVRQWRGERARLARERRVGGGVIGTFLYDMLDGWWRWGRELFLRENPLLLFAVFLYLQFSSIFSFPLLVLGLRL